MYITETARTRRLKKQRKEHVLKTGKSDKYCEHMHMRSTGGGWNVKIRESGGTASQEGTLWRLTWERVAHTPRPQ